MGKRILAVLLVVCLVLTMVPVFAMAAGKVHTEENGNVIYEEKPDNSFNLNSVQVLLVEVLIVAGICVGGYFAITRWSQRGRTSHGRSRKRSHRRSHD